MCTGIYAAMAAKTSKCEWLMRGRKESCGLSEAIQKLPPELREMILKEYVAIKVKEKNEMGWCDAHEELENLPYCEKQGQITKVFTCPKCNTCKLTGLCVACYKNGKEYHTLVGREEVDELEQKKMVKTWGQTKLLSEINEEFQKKCISYKQKEQDAKSHIPYCIYFGKNVRAITCFEDKCFFEGCCFPCYEGGYLHKVCDTSEIPWKYLKVCSQTYDWHDWYRKGTKNKKKVLESIFNKHPPLP